MYRATTRNIQVDVEPFYLEEESSPASDRYFWAYSVTITNLGRETVQLRSRYWHITDALGNVEEVRGPGVVGEEPVLKAGETFEYTSGCPLKVPSGIMMGSYQMESEAGETFDIEVPAFSLDLPEAIRTLN